MGIILAVSVQGVEVRLCSVAAGLLVGYGNDMLASRHPIIDLGTLSRTVILRMGVIPAKIIRMVLVFSCRGLGREQVGKHTQRRVLDVSWPFVTPTVSFNLRVAGT